MEYKVDGVSRPVKDVDIHKVVTMSELPDGTKKITPEYVYLTIPAEYVCVYHKLLSYIADFGKSIIDDCSFACKGDGRKIYNCWSLFQSACAAYTVDDKEKAKFYLDYVSKQLEQYYKGTTKEQYTGGYYYPITPDGVLKAQVSCSTGNVDFLVDEKTFELYADYTNQLKDGDVYTIDDDGNLVASSPFNNEELSKT